VQEIQMSRDTNRSNAEQLTWWRILEHAREERRRILRRKVNIAARIDVDGTIRDCTVVDISELGANVAVEAADQLPDSFMLLLTPSGHPARRCRVAWRSGENVGVEFLPETPSEDHPSVH
jgi:hypothetical protein